MDKHPRLQPEELDALMKKAGPLAAGFDALSDHVIVTDATGAVVYANKAVERETGFGRAEIVGKNPGDLWGGKMPKEFYEKMWHTINVEKKPFVGEVENRRKDGTTYWQEIHISPILDEKGEPQFFIGIEPDITARKDRDKFREEFISILGHQLQDPLTATKWMLGSLLKTTESGAGAKTADLVSLYDINESAISLVTDLLAIARIGTNGMPEEVFDLADEIEAISIETKKMNPRVAITFKRQGGMRFTVRAVKSFAIQVFTNLFGNAAEYSDPMAGDVHAMLAAGDDGYLFSIENNGHTIAPGDQSKVFTKLFRGEGAQKVREHGTGLGLYIVKLICQKFGWKIWFNSPRPGKPDGTEFFVHIPKIDAGAKAE